MLNPEDTPNAELAYRVLDQIDADPKLWNQTAWITETGCGTAGCFAGWACMLSGLAPQRRLVAGDTVSHVYSPDGKALDVEATAVELLRLRWAHADALFDADNSRADLGRLVTEIFGPRPSVDQDESNTRPYSVEGGADRG